MRIAAINESGGVGKTMIAAYLLHPRMPKDTRFFAVETLNRAADDLGISNVERFKGKEFGDLYEELMVEDDAIVDVGASNIEQFWGTIRRYKGGAQEIDLYVIPCPADSKYVRESIHTAEVLKELGVPARQIRFLPNRIDPETKADEATPDLFAYVKDTKAAWIHPEAAIVNDPLFEELAAVGLTLEGLLADDTDYKALARAEADREKRSQYTQMRRLIAQAGPIKQDLDRVFKLLMAK